MYPFSYPGKPHDRQHGPRYASTERYRRWLRDEFVFRCVYCLMREQWVRVRRSFDLEHFIPQALDPAAALDYDNLLYACGSCNSAKGRALVPNPCDYMIADDVVVHDDGRIEGQSLEARKLIRVLGLDSKEDSEWRMLWIGVGVMRDIAPDLFHLAMKYPDDLPDLAALRPSCNSRPDGVRNSHRARRDRGELPEIY